jgi:hypothetical protein
MTTRTLPYDVAAQLRTPAEAIAYLTAWARVAPLDWVGFLRALRDAARAIPAWCNGEKE